MDDIDGVAFGHIDAPYLRSPEYIASDREGNALITESKARARVSVWERRDLSCKYLTCFGGGSGNGENMCGLQEPSQICADRHGRVYVVDAKTRRIHLWSY
jgi:hypothetical protein